MDLPEQQKLSASGLGASNMIDLRGVQSRAGWIARHAPATTRKWPPLSRSALSERIK
jgi:hypothetical protein